MNLYGYVHSNAVNKSDPFGLIDPIVYQAPNNYGSFGPLPAFGSNFADWADAQFDTAGGLVGDPVIGINLFNPMDPQLQTVFGTARGFCDIFRVGNGLAAALYSQDENGWGRAAFVAMDVSRASGLFSLMAGPSARLGARGADRFSRNPLSLQDQMVMDAAKQGAGRKLPITLIDRRYRGMEKWEYSEKADSGKRSNVHYVHDPKTGKRIDFKFKQHSEQ